jgi:hypothetical protein
VRVADRELQVGALERGAVADALDLEPLLEAPGDALDHVRDERPRQTVQRAIFAALGRTRDRDGAVRLLDLHPLRHLLRERAERAGDRDAGRLDRDGDAVGDLDWSFADSAHCLSLRERLVIVSRIAVSPVEIISLFLTSVLRSKMLLPDEGHDFPADPALLRGPAGDETG